MIELKDISFYYKKNKPLFQDLNLKLENGHIYGFLGKNGAGKTTIMKILSGLLFPQAGNCNVLGFNPKYRQASFLSDVFYVAEELYTPSITISNYIKRYAPFYPNFDQNKFDQYIKEFNVEKNSLLTGLSYGQKKKVILSFGLATQCKLLIMDEPTNGLDIPSKAQFRKILAGSITKEQTFILSTHQVKDLTNLIDNIIILDQSKIIFHENISRISEKMYFGFSQGLTSPENVFYSERCPGGYMIVKENNGEVESEVEIETLFNAVIQNQAKVQSLFKKN